MYQYIKNILAEEKIEVCCICFLYLYSISSKLFNIGAHNFHSTLDHLF